MTDRVGIPALDDDVSSDELREAVEHMHGMPARLRPHRPRSSRRV